MEKLDQGLPNERAFFAEDIDILYIFIYLLCDTVENKQHIVD